LACVKSADYKRRGALSGPSDFKDGG
jgi:hypothetical protein